MLLFVISIVDVSSHSVDSMDAADNPVKNLKVARILAKGVIVWSIVSTALQRRGLTVVSTTRSPL